MTMPYTRRNSNDATDPDPTPGAEEWTTTYNQLYEMESNQINTSFVMRECPLTHSIRVILFAAAIFLLGNSSATSGTTNVEKSKHGIDPQASSRDIAHTTYDGPLFPAIKDGKYGFIDIKGNFIIPPSFTSARDFSEGLAAVNVEGRSYIDSTIDRGGYQYISVEKGKWGYIDRTGEMKIPPQFSEAREFHEGLALVAVGDEGPSLEEFTEETAPLNPDYSRDEITKIWRKEFGNKVKFGYIDTQGLFKVPPKYEGLSSDFKHGIATVQLASEEPEISEQGNFVDSSGNVLDASQVESIMDELGKEHWIDASGKDIDHSKALRIMNVDRTAFKQPKTVKIHGKAFEASKHGLKDLNGNIVVSAQFDTIGDFYSTIGERREYKFTHACIASTWKTYGNFAMAEASKCGLIDIHGKFIIPPDFDRIYLMSGDLV